MSRSSRFLGSAFVAFVVVALAASAVLAQDDGGRRGGRGRGGFGGGFGGFGGGTFMLLGSEQVQNELELVDDQKEEIRKIMEESRGERGERGGNFRDLSEDERRERFEAMRARNEEAQKKVDEVLLPHQKDRLKQISLQMRGVSALSDPEVADELGLSADQKDQIEKAGEGMREAMREAFQGGGNREGGRERFQALQKENEEKVLAVLTSEQKTKFDEMKGEKFEFDRSQFGRGGAGRRGGRGGDNN